jgi:hypothetical protein
MRIEYDPNLVEQTVFLAARRDARLECDLHQAVDPFYKMADEEGRSRAFREVTGEFFRRLHLDRIVPSFVAERPLIGQHIRACVVFEAAHGKAQSADVFVKQESAGGQQTQRTLVIRVCPESLLDVARLAPWLRRELLHAADIVDPAFGYSVNDIAGQPHEQRLVLDRYRVLWDVYVEGRLVREGRSEAAMAPRLWGGFARAFTYREHKPSREAFEMFLPTSRLTHRQLLEWASDPMSLCPDCDADAGEGNLLGLVLC